MEDKRIVELYLARDELAVSATHEKYGTLLLSIAGKILGDNAAAEECLNDAYLALWNSVPREEPINLRAYACKVVRNLAFKRLGFELAEKRSVRSKVPLEELEAALSDGEAYAAFEEVDFSILVNGFLHELKPESRKVFLKRYFFFDTVPEIACDLGISESKVKSLLFRARNKFKGYVRKEVIQ